MAKLTTKQRKSLPKSSFAIPGIQTRDVNGDDRRAYPIENASHARNALARVSQHGTPEEKRRVRAAVHRRYPGIQMMRHS